MAANTHKKGKETEREMPGPPAKMKRKEYEEEMRVLHAELVAVQEWVKANKARIVILFEGRDAAGKGGIIKRHHGARQPASVSPGGFAI